MATAPVKLALRAHTHSIGPPPSVHQVCSADILSSAPYTRHARSVLTYGAVFAIHVVVQRVLVSIGAFCAYAHRRRAYACVQQGSLCPRWLRGRRMATARDLAADTGRGCICARSRICGW